MTPKLGEVFTGEQQRDAVHVAIAPMMANEKLSPGQDVAQVEGSPHLAEASRTPIGIVDPFLQRLIYPGEQFWMFLFPETTQGMRHHWKHPAFPDPQVETETQEEEFDQDRQDCIDRGCP